MTAVSLQTRPAQDHGSQAGLGDDDHLQYLLLAGRVGGQVAYGGVNAVDDLDLYPNSTDPLGGFAATTGFVKVNGRVLFTGFTDLTTGSGVPSPNFQLVRFNDICNCAGQGGIIPQGFWWTPTFQYNAPQTFGGASTFQDGSVWEETAALGGAHGFFTLGSFLGGCRYRIAHAGAGIPPTEIFGLAAQPGADAGIGTLTVAEINAVQTNAVFGLKAFLSLEELRNGVVVTTYRHFVANSNIANGLVLHGGSSIGTEIGLDLRDINHGTTKISVRSNQASAYMEHVGQIRVPSDANGFYCGAALDAFFRYNGTVAQLDCGSVNPSDLDIDCGTEKTLRLVEEVWDDLRVPLTSGKTGVTNPPAWAKFMDDGAGSVGVYAWSFADEAVVGNEEQLWFAVQLPHKYSQGTDIEAHLHWSPAVSGGVGEFVKWGLEYTWANIDGTFSNTTIITSDASSASTATTSGDTSLVADKHYRTIIGMITGTGKGISSMLVCRLFRNSSHADDDLAQAAFALEYDFHFELDTIGSRQLSVK